MNGNMIFAKRIKQLREEKGDSQESLAAIFNYSKQAVSNWEVSGKIPRHKVLEKLAERYNISIDYLIGFTDDPQPTKNAVKQKKPRDLIKILEQEEYTLNGQIASQEDREKLAKIVEALYWDAKEKNKRKK
ncbi:transcriptional regulator with XRE-family HTH domain [Sporomusaceae bacterium BoRhaA]|uniref:helix-turn-helix domain-containing protein n=1 Tax=Pelorhabdus rhamnosifermentans TaxID=2772457 RepID=UPI001C062CF7|nr:helix-turn-helix transcriptional regulator [Pelorhabdus rhamnosifermentans]MBU2702269.1 transcriptional regulator with XRE-family HTH domain [Pelorhabdus rhamnosifermentans]